MTGERDRERKQLAHSEEDMNLKIISLKKSSPSPSGER